MQTSGAEGPGCRTAVSLSKLYNVEQACKIMLTGRVGTYRSIANILVPLSVVLDEVCLSLIIFVRLVVYADVQPVGHTMGR